MVDRASERGQKKRKNQNDARAREICTPSSYAYYASIDGRDLIPLPFEFRVGLFHSSFLVRLSLSLSFLEDDDERERESERKREIGVLAV